MLAYALQSGEKRLTDMFNPADMDVWFINASFCRPGADGVVLHWSVGHSTSFS